jgi:hypothetical protein
VAFSTRATTSFGTALMRRHAFRESKAASRFAATAVWSRTTCALPTQAGHSQSRPRLPRRLARDYDIPEVYVMEQLHTISRSLTALVNLSSGAPVSRRIARHAHDSPYPQLFWRNALPSPVQRNETEWCRQGESQEQPRRTQHRGRRSSPDPFLSATYRPEGRTTKSRRAPGW